MQKLCERVNPETGRMRHFPAGGGGNMHAIGHCPTPPGPRGDHRRRKLWRKRRNKRDAEMLSVRGSAVAGTGKPKGGEKKKAKKAAGAGL